MDRLIWISCLSVLLFCISATSKVYGDELSEGLELMNDGTVKIQGDAAFPGGGDPDTKADIAFLVHVNKGTKKSDMENLVNFLKSLLTYSDIDSGAVRVALAYYKLNVKVDFDFSAYSTKNDINNALDQFKESKARSPKANVAGALKSLQRLLLNSNKGDRPDAKNYVILITDLEANAKKNLVKANSQILKDTGAEVITVGVGLPDSTELRTIASEPPGLHSFYADDYAALRGITSNILRMVPPLYPVAPVSTTVAPPKPADPRVYTTSDELDLVFAIHLSEKVTDVEIQELMVYIRTLLERANIVPGKVRVGAVAYTDVGSILFKLREFSNVSLITELLASQLSNYKSDSASVASLLETVRTDVFGDPSSDRENVPNALLIITDKNSNMQLDSISSQAEKTQNQGNRIFTVGIQLDDKAELETISSKPTDKNVFAVISYNELPLTKGEILSQLYAREYNLPKQRRHIMITMI